MNRPDVPSASVQKFLSLLENVRPTDSGWSALCPAHDDNRPSLSIAQGADGKVLVTCFAGCTVDEIADAAGLEVRDLFASSDEASQTAESISGNDVVATYDYVDEVGNLFYQVVRYAKKRFRPRRPAENGGWRYDLAGVRRVPYNLPDVITASHVIVVEGEKDADRVRKALGRFRKWKSARKWAATTCSGGTSGWQQQFAPYLTGKAVYILPDNDSPGRDFAEKVARSISPYARGVKIVSLPDLPEKGDVSDFLQVNSAQDLQEELRKAPVFKPTATNPQGDGSSFSVARLRDLFDQPEEERSWLVDGLLPAGGSSLLVAKPKVGKSTLARQLALKVARGEPFLGRRTEQGAVLYLALEEKNAEVTRHFRDLGATGNEEILIHCAPAPIEAMEQARILLKQNPASLLIIDPLFKFTRVRDGNDYAGMTAALEPIVTLARQSGTHILLVHHSGKAERDDPMDAVLGSTALFANVDTSILLNRSDEYRTILTRQRYGQELEESVLAFDPDRRSMTLGATRQQTEREKLGNEILDFLRANPNSLEADMLAGVVGRRQRKVVTLRALVGTKIVRDGKGGRKDPFRYSLAGGKTGTRTAELQEIVGESQDVLVPEARMSPGNNNGNMGTRTAKTEEIAGKPQKILVPGVPSSPGNNKNLGTETAAMQEILVPKVPSPRGNNNGNIESKGFRSPRISERKGNARRYSKAEYQEQLAILVVDGGLSRAEAVRTLNRSMEKRP